MNKTSLFFTLLFSISIFSNPLAAASKSKKHHENIIKKTLKGMVHRGAKVGWCLLGEETCSPLDFAIIISTAIFLNGFIRKAAHMQLPSGYKEYAFKFDLNHFGYRMANKYFPYR